MKTLALLLLAACAYGQNIDGSVIYPEDEKGNKSLSVGGGLKPKKVFSVPESACGMDKQRPTFNIDLIQVSCIDYDAMRVRIPQVVFTGNGWATQVLAHIAGGRVVYISVNGGKTYKREPVKNDAWGRRVALIEFKGLRAAKDIVVRVSDEEVE